MEELSSITIDDFLIQDRTEHERIEREYYIRKYNDCVHLMVESKRNQKTHCIYKVRQQEIDSNYNFMDCIAFIIDKLKKRGFTQVTYCPPNLIRISWINESIEKAKIKNLQLLHAEAIKPEQSVVIAPPIMWFGSKSRQDEAALKEIEVLSNKKLLEKKLKKSGNKPKTKQEFIEASKRFLLDN
jgi:hypothetical protein